MLLLLATIVGFLTYFGSNATAGAGFAAIVAYWLVLVLLLLVLAGFGSDTTASSIVVAVRWSSATSSETTLHIFLCNLSYSFTKHI